MENMYKDLNTEYSLKGHKTSTKICLYFYLDFNMFEYFLGKAVPTGTEGTNRSVLSLSD